MSNDDVREFGSRWVAIILAVGLSLAITLVTVGVLYDAIFSEGPGLSDNATQVMTTAFGGIIGVLGSYMGFRAGLNANGAQHMTTTPTEPEAPPAEPDDGGTPDEGEMPFEGPETEAQPDE